MESRWVEVDEHSSVFFEYPCTTNRAWCSHFDLPNKSRNNVLMHGHVRISCEDGNATIPAQVESRPFLAFLLQHEKDRGCLSEAEETTILNLQETKQLLEEMTEREIEVTRNPELIKKWTSYGYGSFW